MASCNRLSASTAAWNSVEFAKPRELRAQAKNCQKGPTSNLFETIWVNWRDSARFFDESLAAKEDARKTLEYCKKFKHLQLVTEWNRT